MHRLLGLCTRGAGVVHTATARAHARDHGRTLRRVEYRENGNGHTGTGAGRGNARHSCVLHGWSDAGLARRHRLESTAWLYVATHVTFRCWFPPPHGTVQVSHADTDQSEGRGDTGRGTNGVRGIQATGITDGALAVSAPDPTNGAGFTHGTQRETETRCGGPDGSLRTP